MYYKFQCANHCGTAVLFLDGVLFQKGNSSAVCHKCGSAVCLQALMNTLACFGSDDWLVSVGAFTKSTALVLGEMEGISFFHSLSGLLPPSSICPCI